MLQNCPNFVKTSKWLFLLSMMCYTEVCLLQETRKKKELKVKIQMAKFLQDTIEDMAVASKNKKKKESVDEFAHFFDRVSSSG